SPMTNSPQRPDPNFVQFNVERSQSGVHSPPARRRHAKCSYFSTTTNFPFNTPGGHIMTHDIYQDCIDACVVCAQVCEHCADACLGERDVANMVDCIRLDRACAAICRAASVFMRSNSEFAQEICGLCADVCDACATECRKHQMDHCQQCAVE